MKNSTAWSLLACSMALASYALHRDISANIFLACVFVIQGLKRMDGSTQERRGTFLAVAVSVGITIFALYVLFGGVEFHSPAKFHYRK